MNEPERARLSLVRLMQLASPALPIGSYSYSQGLESAVEMGIVGDAASATAWIADVLDFAIARGDAAMAWRLLFAAAWCDVHAFVEWNAWFLATRETSELRAETLQTGGSLAKLAVDLGIVDAKASDMLRAATPLTLPAAHAVAARALHINASDALHAFIWSWLENQVLAAIKLVPLGQVAGQRMLHGFGEHVVAAAERARSIADDDVASFAPGLALASSRHETQYSRLFRS
jgi:urease accessory protein